MTLKKLTLNRNQKGFTLIELMIVIAIIGILAAIAIPNFIAYRNKSYCSSVESDANTIAAKIADYFAIPTNTSVSTNSLTFEATGANTWHVGANNMNSVITISVSDGSTRCPLDYRNAHPASATQDGWVGNTFEYRKLMLP